MTAIQSHTFVRIAMARQGLSEFSIRGTGMPVSSIRRCTNAFGSNPKCSSPEIMQGLSFSSRSGNVAAIRNTASSSFFPAAWLRFEGYRISSVPPVAAPRKHCATTAEPRSVQFMSNVVNCAPNRSVRLGCHSIRVIIQNLPSRPAPQCLTRRVRSQSTRLSGPTICLEKAGEALK